MSASEKLRALDDHRPYTEGYARRRHDDRIADALPQIVAVVKAAELLVTEAQEIHASEYPSTLKSYRASHAALAALDEALS